MVTVVDKSGRGKSLEEKFGAERVASIRADLTDASEVESAVAEAAERRGGIDAVIALAGGWGGGDSVAETDPDEWQSMFDLNLRTAFLTARAALPLLLAADWGRLVFVSSKAAYQPGANQVAYNASKAGVIALVGSLHAELRDSDVTANCIVPSIIDTPANRKAMPGSNPTRWVEPREIANVVAFLASAQSAAIDGAAIPVYGKT